ncbi:HD-GYP domain-containing protein [Schlesneria paludicola]|uniref:HD-GYP domain-containing protein n=1 Tax=Schlesneria paludicola TaxID=360056 RepID=UPI0002DAC1A0|nr:HD-GYP domain-containing protein [Schlesneria paludicola]
MLPGELLHFVLPVPMDNRYVIEGFARGGAAPIAFALVAHLWDSRWDETQFQSWAETVPVCEQRILERLLLCSLRTLEKDHREAELQLEVRSLTQQMDYAQEQMNLLHVLAHNLHLSRPTEELASLCLGNLESLIDCGGAVICFEDIEKGRRFLPQGELPFDDAGLSRLLARFEHNDWSQPLVRNKLHHSVLGSEFPGLKNLVIASIGDDAHRYGWIVACNLRGGTDFEMAEASLVGSIATILGTHAQNIRLFDEHDDLLLSFVRSLVSSLDAKDRHTRGHSERVALIARRIGMELHLADSDLDDIYLSSLLHDLGKIGVDDRILSKPGRLTISEFAQIQQHPLIGHQILQQLKNLKSILPGVRNHHEAYNGSGYPDQLRGEDIPLMARIISVADSYDAMVTDRPYRKGMPLEKVEEIFHRGAGEQWDPRVIEAYFAARDDIRVLFESYSSTIGNLLDNQSLSQSGIFSSRTGLR